jgi:hypothetical protein
MLSMAGDQGAAAKLYERLESLEKQAHFTVA